MGEIECVSRVARVEVYARGAVVTRRVSAASLPAEPCELVIGGVTPAADAGSFRAAPDGGRRVIALRSSLVIPAAPAGPGPSLVRVRELEAEQQRLARALQAAGRLRAALLGVRPQAGFDARGRLADPAARAADALAIAGLAGELVGEQDARAGELEQALEAVARQLEAARLEAAQAESRERAGAGHPSREVRVRLAEGASGPLELELSYAVAAARWWPAYAARLEGGGASAELAFTAFVAQASGESWSDVELALSTADLVQDARLPELPSLRLSRAQPKPRRGYRPPPPGLDALFASWDLAMSRLPPPPAAPPPRRRERRTTMMQAKSAPSTIPPEPADAGAGADWPEETTGQHALDELAASPEVFAAMAPPPPPRAMPAPMMAPMSGAPPPPAPARMASRRREAAAEAPGGGGAADDRVRFGQAAAQAIEPEEGWLDFDALVMGAGDAPPDRRGRLRREPGAPPVPGGMAAGTREIEQLAGPPHAVDPRAARGRFDHRYPARARVDVPSDARPHRLAIAAAPAPAKLLLTCVPREEAAVFREVELANPYPSPLLGGPVDVYVDGALLTTTVLAPVDTGGLVRLGLGVEDRLRVARNVRVEESTAGLLGGKAVIEHRVEIELRSSLGRAVTVEVIDRAPVSDDDDIDIAVEATPAAERYTQAERGRPVRGGLRWRLAVEPGGKQRVELLYRVTIPAKNELEGGNRRE